MPSLIKEIRKLFETEDLYEVLGIQRSATKSEVKKAYYKLSLVVHPDRVSSGDRSLATKKFQALGKVYSILSDDEKRVVYDETGSVDEDDIERDRDWSDYWRLLFPKVDVDAIKDFEAKYKGSSEELECIKDAYLKCKGDMDGILDRVLCSTVEDEQRFRETITELISENQLPEFDAFVNESADKSAARKRKAKREAEQAAKVLKKMESKKGGDNLEALILRNQKNRQEASEDFIRQMESKYGASQGRSSSGTRSKKSANAKQSSRSAKK